VEWLEDRRLLATFLVTNVNDSGDGSLRQAILDANANPGLDTVAFNVGGGGAQTISPTSALPTVTDGVMIDGTTQPGFAGQPLIVVNGGSAPGNVDGLKITGGNSTVKGLVLNGWRVFGVELDGNGGNVLTGNYIGTDASGGAALGNTFGGVYVASSNNTIGGAGPGDGNVIAGNGDQIFISEVNTPAGNVVQGNFIGTDSSGTVALGNSDGGGNGDGVIVYQGARNNLIGGPGPGAGNVISGNRRFGVNLSAAGPANVVQGNFIGTDSSGGIALGNGSDGVFVASTPGTTVAGNVISANGGAGVDVLGFAATNNRVQGNFIGTDVSGTAALGNALDGVQVFFGSGNTVGGTAAGAGNVIGANGGSGVLLSAGATSALVQGNFIGTDTGGTINLGNTADGMTVASSSGNAVGGTAPGAGNVIAFNGNDGVKVDTGTGNAIRQNSIHDSGNLGIELVNNGNNNQPAPALASAATTGSGITIQGTLTAAANTTYALDFFANPAANASGSGEGQQLLGSVTGTTDGSGTVTFTVTFSVAVPAGQAVSATATSPAGNTSAFAQDVTAGAAPPSWVALGPAALSFTYPANENFSGRIAGIAASPTDPNTIYVAAAGGGVWKTTDGGATWAPLTDDQATLSMGAIAVAPSNPNVIYAGTGEANNVEDSNYGRGILVSTDGGATWTLTGASAFDRLTVAKIAVDPTDPNTAYAAVGDFATNGRPFAAGTGIYKTTDGGATWTDTTASLGQFDPYSDVAIDPHNHTTLYMAIGDHFGDAYHTGANGVYKSTDAGASWTKLGGGLPTNANAIGRIALAVAPSNSQVVYVSIAGTGQAGSSAHGALFKMMRSDNGGSTWTDLTAGTPNYLDFQGAYDTTLIVDPTNATVVYAGGAAGPAFGEPPALIRSTDAGVSWSDLDLTGGPITPHADHHAIAFDANGRLLDGDDGGIFRLDSATPVQWSDLNGNLNTIQFEGVDISPTDPGVAVGGSQDNGTALYSGNPVWAQTDGGDGGWAKFSPTNPNRVYHQAPADSFGAGFFRRSDDGGQTWVSVTSGLAVDANNQNFYAPFVVDPGNGDRVLYGTNRVWETTTGGDGWAPISPVLTGAHVDAIGLAAGDADTVYASFGGEFANSSRVFVTTDHGATWVEHDLPSGSGRVADLQVDPTNAQVAYAVVGRFGGGHVFRTADGGATWTNISGNLPDLPTWSLQLGKTDSGDVLYVGNDDGVYFSTDLGASWSRLSTGMPHVQVLQLALNSNLQLLGAATHGRGMWELSLAGAGQAPLTRGPAAPPLSAAAGPARAGATNDPANLSGLPPLGSTPGTAALPLPTGPLLTAAPGPVAPFSLAGPPAVAPSVLAAASSPDAGVTGALDRFFASAADDLGAALVRADSAAPADDWSGPLVEALAALQAPARK
jgi:hypothetical protein